MEDYNTGTLPHKKYYDLIAYEKKKALRAVEDGSDNVIRAICLIASVQMLAFDPHVPGLMTMSGCTIYVRRMN